jgi:hypothetical protein
MSVFRGDREIMNDPNMSERQKWEMMRGNWIFWISLALVGGFIVGLLR